MQIICNSYHGTVATCKVFKEAYRCPEKDELGRTANVTKKRKSNDHDPIDDCETRRKLEMAVAAKVTAALVTPTTRLTVTIVTTIMLNIIINNNMKI